MLLDYEIRFSSKRKTLGIVVERDARVVVLAPDGLAPSRISEIVRQKQKWIKSKLQNTEKYPSEAMEKEFVTGESILYLGKECQLIVVDDKWFDGVKYDGNFYIARHTQPKANAVFRGWYTQQAYEIIKPLAENYANSLGVSYNNCRVSEMKYRWASCTPNKNLVFNWRSIKAPLKVIHYLIVHELAHLIESSHSSNFWNIVATQLPNYKEAKDWLKHHGELLEIDF
ncbi:M48 family metallopeptidase [uncultured Bacteroides sp.]|uniref:M48 family metallopeptidase n=1 Tax=uncultured Bacteroides sp. TaxID=162156 RepID=UPI00266F19F0|nr:SprT family zinc-dependent metalloprotease [uncultured Bacteroides sp.]